MTEYEDAYYDDEDLYEDDELAEIAELLDAQKEEAFWADAQERFEKGLGRKLTRREIDGMNERGVEYEGGDPVENVRQAYDAYYAESSQPPYENRPSGQSEWAADYINQALEPRETHTVPGEKPSGEAA